MPEHLMESEFITTNLSTFFANRKATDSTNFDWEKYFTDNWKNKEVAQQLINCGELLRKAIKILGFKDTNPILAFLKLTYVQENLIATKLLNANTFKAIYNAVAKKLVADSEFFKDSDYNIIYCRDLYNRSASEVEKYLEKQAAILKFNPEGGSYSEAVQKSYIENLLQVGEDVRKPEAKLKSLKSLKDTDEQVEDTVVTKKTADETRFVAGLKSKNDIKKALQILGADKINAEAKAALEGFVYQDSIEKYMSNVLLPLNKLSLNTRNINNLVNLLLDKLKG